MDYGEIEKTMAPVRDRVREMISESLPEDYLGPFTDDAETRRVSQLFVERLAREGMLTRAWPKEFGGENASMWEQTAIREEMWAHHEPRGAHYMGLNWVGPAIMRYGTDAQKNWHLPRIARGASVWCQGFSEPEAGSDLASLRTRADRTPSGWRINGSKIWTSYAQMADHCFLLTRTSNHDLRQKHRGITVFLLPLDRPGIQVRPIDGILGRHHLNEVFLDDVEVTDDDVLGEVDNGWEVAKYVLAHERVGIARYARCDRLLNKAVRTLREQDGADVPDNVAIDLGRALVHTRIARLLAYRVVQKQASGTVTDGDAAVARIAVVLLDREVGSVLADALGPARYLADDGLLAKASEFHWRYSRASTVASGALEVLKVLVARDGLGGKAWK